MKFTTDLERYLFACAAYEKAEVMLKFANSQMNSSRSEKIRDEYEKLYIRMVKRSNFWWKVRKHFEFVTDDLSGFTRIKFLNLVG